MNKVIFITILSLIVFVSTTLSLSLSSPEFNEIIGFDEIIGEAYDNDIPVCNVNTELSGNCKNINNQLVCQSIANCFAYYANDKEGLVVNVPSGIYTSSDCPGTIIKGPLGGVISIVSSGEASFYCGSNQFLNYTFTMTASVKLQGITINGGGEESENGCVQLTDSYKGLSLAYISGVSATNCNSKNKINGGFLTLDNFNTAYIIQSNISGNSALYTSTIVAGDSTINLYNSIFSFNKGYSGAVVSGENVIVWNSLLENNFASSSGGCVSAEGTIYVNNTQFINNYAVYLGGVFYTTSKLSTWIGFSIFQNNSASFGGVIYSTSGNISIEYSEFNANIAQRDGIKGGGGAIYLFGFGYTKPSILNLVNCTFDNNVSNNGGAIYLDAASLISINSSFTYNTAIGDGGAIGWINDGGKPQVIDLINNTLYYNYAFQNGGAVYLNQYYDQPLYLNFTGAEFDHNQAVHLAGSVFFVKVPEQFVGGVFTNSRSGESKSMTFYSQAIRDENIVYFENDLPEYTVPIFNESTFKYWKVFGAHGYCQTGVAVINENGVILSCRKLNNRLHFAPN